ncbi:MAG: diguanylate cyclase [Pirellulaceae bacterium]
MQDQQLNLSTPTLPIGQISVPSHVAEASDRLVKSRLGAFAGLFYALRAKHPPTAAHSLRVAVGCSKWAAARGIKSEERDVLEVSALLHDVGKIGIPDSILQKPDRLDGHEAHMMDMSCSIAVEMLRGAGASEIILRIVEESRSAFETSPDQHPLARMMAIVDAFDSMTTEQVFRRAHSRDRAIEELCSHAGVQFDPALVRDFVELVIRPRPDLEAEMIQRWLSELAGDSTPGFSGGLGPSGALQSLIDTVFHRRLLDTLSDVAIYLDAGGQILHWNRAAERLSGHRAESLMHCTFNSELLGLSDEAGQPLAPDACPLAKAANTNTLITQRMQVVRPDGQRIKVNFSAIPVFSNRREYTGLIIMIRDASAQAHLEERVQTLNAIASQDTLTKVANRAALTDRLPQFVREHLQSGRRGSVIMCDIDFFKRINDNFGHQAGDDALVTFANLLRESSREDDFVARYGGEEFVVLCSDCDNPAATIRAEEMRRAVEGTPIPALDGKTMTSSFGVTEIQDGDTEETLLARADRALLTAKESGRNRVVQLGAGMAEKNTSQNKPQQVIEPKSNWLGWFRESGITLVEREYLASVPEAVAVQKLKGFISDHQAEVLSADETHVSIRIDGFRSEGVRRRGERAAVILLDIRVQGVQVFTHGRNKAYQNRTKFKVSARPVKTRDRRADILLGQVHQILYSFQAYMVAQEIDENLRLSIIEPR